MLKFLFCLLISPLAWAQVSLFNTKGQQPDICLDKSGKIELVFGQKNKLFYSFSLDQGKHFSEPSLVDSLVGLHLGASRGPRIASSNKLTIITAVDKSGNIYAFRKSGNNVWVKNRVNDIPEIAKEGFNAIAANEKHQFTVIWLDLRNNQKNKLMSSTSVDGGKTWQKNQLVYASPESSICECCQPNIMMKDGHIAIMFRNWLQGARDMYVIQSQDGGKSFGQAQKLGMGTWVLNACPMDGGSLDIAPNGEIVSVWRRAENLYTSGIQGEEKLVGPGKNASTVMLSSGQWITWSHMGQIFLKSNKTDDPKSLGNGKFPIMKAINAQQAYIVWENQGQIFGQVL
ncbi:exo-alpha-sialidase [Cytophagaceae bacterium 50C-KIRBA]|uniref:Exo-alpha-sialidase n=1 Tax=Aquirufa beregesia TaxID=2516556 RepID=A0ABX0EUI4_9BACT|nr:exo-alpha-sialidase [Aquirufa beregesia]NGZ43726.1 exo-alpha-sialidase [Aquirufa beregesia]